MKFVETEINQFKLLFFKLFQFIIVFFLIDLSLGFFAKEIFFSQKSGKYSRITYSIKKDSSDVLIMGSSHANRHYIPEIFEKKLGITSYNAGVQGQQIIFITALQEMILKRHKPKLIILNIDQDWMYESKEAYERLADLHPYYWDYKTELDPVLSLNTRFHTLKLLFRSYQTNSSIVHVIKYFLQPQEDFNGYRPLYTKMDKPKPSDLSIVNFEIKTEESQRIDSNFIIMFKDFINNTKKNNIGLIFVISPHISHSYGGKVNRSLELMKSIALKDNIPLIDFSNSKAFNEQYQLFNDPSHLNNDGAILFSNSLADILKEKIELIN